jgi:hypothetical protein
MKNREITKIIVHYSDKQPISKYHYLIDSNGLIENVTMVVTPTGEFDAVYVCIPQETPKANKSLEDILKRFEGIEVILPIKTIKKQKESKASDED